MRKSQESKAVRQNSIYTSTSKRAVNLRRNPTLHFQIGLILALLTAIFLIEMRMPQKAILEPRMPDPVEEIFTIDQVQVEREVLKAQKFQKSKRPETSKVLDKDPKITDDLFMVDSPIDFMDPTDEPMVEPGMVDFIGKLDESEPETTIFSLVEQVPLFPGCEGLSDNRERRDCMSSKISKFVSKRFRTEKGEGLGLEGANRIFVTFKINAEGKVVDVVARGPHNKLEEEAKRVTSLLPDMIAGKQGGKNVEVLFSLPINFKIQE
ncbi:energy transducer TonB [Dokdonia sp. Hel_I_53]|uniref:energy transducer TonB n=1 Tax=Dokdonia sp. Hel_I_53 TaxID=1566287 RepID=UPI00119BA007|nr:energy transducer TonB [Dokdonia sp. Hel_I_53]TVZ52233.1 protein TonB [Dokdonia sp. Hel_I_53]